MKMYAFVILATALSLSTVSSAWKEVGNAAGMSEQNIIYAQQNAELLLFRAGKMLTLKSDRALFLEFLSNLKNSRLEFNYEQNVTSAFSVQGSTWTLYSVNLLKYDQDDNQVLSLKESYQLLLDVFALKMDLEDSAIYLSFEESLLQIFAASEETWILKSFNEELQWTEFSDAYYVFYADSKPLRLSADLLQSRLCTGELTNMKLHNPAMTSVQKSESEVRMLVVVDSYYQCDGKPLAKRLPLDLSAGTQKEAQLKLR